MTAWIVCTKRAASAGSAVNVRGASDALSTNIFKSSSEIGGAAKLFYTTVGLPGWDLDTGTASTVTSAPNAWTSVSTRNIAG